MSRRGLSLVELLLALTLTGVVAVAVGSVSITGVRTYSHQMELVRVRANLRAAMATFSRELRGLGSGGRAGSDIAEMNQSAITYRANRITYFVCTTPNPDSETLTVWRSPDAGLRQMDPARDSLLVYAENDEADLHDDDWLAAGLTAISAGSYCPGSERGYRLSVSGLSASDLSGVRRGAVVRGYQLTNIRLYASSDGLRWIGVREFRRGSGWSITQPIFGPVSRNGLRLDYLTAGGGLANTPAEVARIAVTVVATGYHPTAGRTAPAMDSLTIHIGLRNKPGRS